MSHGPSFSAFCTCGAVSSPGDGIEWVLSHLPCSGIKTLVRDHAGRGTPKGYYRHLRRGEVPCWLCKAAHAREERLRRARS